jgi:hypothetical protein
MTRYQYAEVNVTPTIEAAAYATGDLITALMTLPNPYVSRLQCELEAIIVRDAAAQSAAMDIVFFHTEPTATTFTLNSALTLAAADLPFVAGHRSIVAGNYCAFAANSVGTVTGIGLPVIKPIGVAQTLWAVAISRGSPTYGSTSALNFSFLFKEAG